MKKICFILVAFIIVFVIGVLGCKGDKGDEGPTGPSGTQGPPGPSYTDMWEDFESGNFTTYPWQMSGDANWHIAVDRTKFGSRSACSGQIGHLQTSSLSISLNLPRAGLVSFYVSISSEMGFDALLWELDGEIVEGVTGIMPQDVWAAFTFAVPPGQHTVDWYYTKDGSVSSGDDCGWLDGVLITNYSLSKIVPLPVLPEGVVLWSQRGDIKKN